VIYSNGASTWYTYDFENLRMNIDHYNGAATPQMILGLEYAFTVNGLVASVTEDDQSGPWPLAVTTFEHDARGRLTEEVRTGTQPYEARYYYDQNGNRTREKLTIGDPGALVCTEYFHSGNRLYAYEKQADFCTGSPIIEEAFYWFDDDWNTTVINRLVYDGEDVTHVVTGLEYDEMGRVWRQTEERVPPAGPVERLGVWEYPYGTRRERYLVRELDPETLEPLPGGDTWSDYLGQSVYADYTVAQD
ncbi:MAG: hypothetical protein GY842_24125, partial [bacterium]|nr:hypothetical protein [bacterium]